MFFQYDIWSRLFYRNQKQESNNVLYTDLSIISNILSHLQIKLYSPF